MKKFILAAVAAGSLFAASAPAFAGYWVYGPYGAHYVPTCYTVCGPFACRWFCG